MIYTPYFFKTALPDAKFITSFAMLDDFFIQNEIFGFCIDSRKIETDQIFIALQGEQVDGHVFIKEVLLKGAVGLIIEEDKEFLLKNIDAKLLENKLVIVVKDSLHALKQLAKIWRHRFKCTVIGVTGSVGKTTTKQMLANIFKQANIPAYVSLKNQNTVIGLSLNILNLRQEHKLAVFEMGISHKGEMEELADVLRPNIGIITYISIAHGQGLGSLKEIAKEKQNIFKFFKSNNIGIIWGDNNKVKNLYYDFPIITFGLKTKNDIQARMININEDGSTSFNLKIYNNKYPIQILNSHAGIINNILASSSLATFLGIDHKFILQGINTYKSFEGRFEQRKLKSFPGHLIHDCYNASPQSMKAALESFSKIPKQKDGLSFKKIVVLGDMLELGKKEIYWHRQTGKLLSKNLDLDFIILVGKLSRHICKTIPAFLKNKTKKVKDWKQASSALNEYLSRSNNKGSVILFKSSRGIGLDNIIKELS
jgi:UDP-N-acetylmuramoyl-tripeptide--D-alanyl-D-alanine ligase